jgi:hypothetical protein
MLGMKIEAALLRNYHLKSKPQKSKEKEIK